MPSHSFRSLRSLALAATVGLVALLTSADARAQLDTRHWIPPLWSVNGTDANVIDDHVVVISTPEVSPVAFTLSDGGGNTYSGTVSNGAPVTLQIGNTASSVFGPYTAGGWSGTHTAHVVIGPTKLNTPLADGLIVDAVRPVYVSIRQKSGSQGEILAAPGRKGLGREFRALFARNVLSTNTWRGSFISVMATEPGTTTITFDDIKPGVKLYGLPDANADGRTDAHTITLSQYQSYIVGVQDAAYTGTAPLADLNGTRVTSDKLVAVTSGYFLGGPSATGGQDAGFDQLVPTELAGTEYVMIKGNALASSELETVTVVATEDGTDLYVGASATPYNATPLDAGDWAWVHGQYTGDGLYLRATKPVLVVQGIGGSDSLATPGANVIPPIGEDASAFVDNIPTVNFYGTATVGIVTRAGASVTINGAAPSVSPQAIAGAPDWVTYKVTGLTGTVAVESNSAVAVSVINVSGVAGLAGYFSGFPSSPTLDLDEDDTADGGDNCPDDPNQDQIDDDGDGIGNLCDQCDADPQKALEGICGCGVPDEDFDADGVICGDNCPWDANPAQEDGDDDGYGDACSDDFDNDGVPNDADECPFDTLKSTVGYCGCGLPETDSDLDGAPNCVDLCALDPAKTAPAACGCGTAETDSDDDGAPDCVDVCGNLEVNPGEECDDGNASDTDACTTQCLTRPIGAADVVTTPEDEAIIIDVQDNDPTSATRAVTTVIVDEPIHGTVLLEPDGRVRYEPLPDHHGTDAFTYRLGDAVSLSDLIAVDITIEPVDDAPVAAAESLTASEGGAASALDGDATSVLDNDDDIDDDALTAVLVDAPAHGALTLNADGTFTYTHDGSETAADAFTYRASDGDLTSAVTTVAIVITPVDDAPTAAPEALASAEGGAITTLVGGATSVLDNDADAEGQPLTATLVDAPAHGALTLNADGTFTYTHDGSETTADAFTYRASDGDLASAVTTVAIVITPVDDAPTAAPEALASAEGGAITTLVGGATSVLDNDADAEGQPLTAILVDTPTHGALTLNADGTFTYTHDGSETTADAFTYRASDGDLTSAVTTVAIVITPVDDAPVAAPDAIALAEGLTAGSLVGGATSVLDNDADAEGQPLTATLVAAPAHGTLTLNPNGTFFYKHDGSETSADAFTYRVAAGALSAVTTVTIAITPVNDAPVAHTDALVAAEGSTVTFLVGGATSLLTNDTDAEGQPLTATLVSPPAHGSLTLNDDGTFAYTHDGSETTSDAFSYQASDGGAASATVTVAITVGAVDEPPVAFADELLTVEGGTATQLAGRVASVLANDLDPESSALTAEIVTGPAHGAVTLADDGTFSYAHDGSETTADAFTYRASDGAHTSAPATVAITVTPVNDPPVAAPDAIDVDEGATVTSLVGGAASLLANDLDAEGQALTALLVSGPSHGALTLHDDGTFGYAHDGSESTSDTFTYRADDGAALSEPITVTIAIAPVDDVPTAGDDAFGVDEGATLSAASVLANDSDAEGHALIVSLEAAPEHGALDITSDGTFSYTHDGSETTTDAFTYRVGDGVSWSPPATVTLSITPINDAPLARADTLVVAEGAATTSLVGNAPSVLANDEDADGDPLVAELVTAPSHGALTLAADGTFTYTHDGSETTADAFTYRAWDGALASEVIVVAITVSPIDNAPVATADAIVVDEGGAATTLVGAATSLLANDTDAEGQGLAAELVAPPAHGALTLYPDGTFEYTHDGSETTADGFTYRAGDGALTSAVTTVAITVTPIDDAPVVLPEAVEVDEGGTATSFVGGATSALANDADAEGRPLSVKHVAGPAHGALTLRPDGTFEYTHDGSETAEDAFVYRVHDGAKTSTDVRVAIVITPVDDAPVPAPEAIAVDEAGTTTTLAGGATSVLANDTDAEGATLVAELVEGPSHGAITLHADGAFVYTHDGSETTSDAFAYRAGDGALTSAVQIVTIAVTPVNDAPVARPDAFTLAEGDAASGSVLADDLDAEGDHLTAILVDGPAHGALALADDGAFTYTHDGSETTNDRFSYRAHDGVEGSEVVVVTLTVIPVDDATVAGDDVITVAEGGAATALDGGATTVLANDVDAESATLVAALVTPPAHGALELHPDGTFRYRHDGSETTRDAFVYRAADAADGASMATVTIVVTPVNDAPVATGDALTVTEGGVARALDGGATSVLANDVDADGPRLTAELVDPPAHGALQLRADGSLRYVHDGSEATRDAFTYRAADGDATSSVVRVLVTVAAVDDAPRAADDALTLTEGGVASRLTGGAASLLDNDGDPEGRALGAALVDPPAHGTLTLRADGTFEYVHDGSESTHDRFRYRASDGANGAEADVTIAIRPVDDAPVAHPDTITLPEGGSVHELADGAPSVLANDTDAEGDALVAELVEAPRRGVVTLAADGRFTYTHDGSDTHVDAFSYRAHDGERASEVVAVSIVITPVDDPARAAPDRIVVEEGGAALRLASGHATLLHNDVDPEGGPLVASLVTAPKHGTLALRPDGTFRYKHDGSETTFDAFDYAVHDGRSLSAPTTVHIDVVSLDDAPVITPVSDVTLTDPETRSLALTLVDADDALDDLVVTAESDDGAVLPPDALELADVDGAISLRVSSAGVAGEARVTLTVADPRGLTDEVSLTVTVVCGVDQDEDGLCDGHDEDDDGDGVPDDEEGFEAPPIDTDDDGIPDAREAELGTDPTLADSDGDGVDDDRELALGTDPRVADPDPHAPTPVDPSELEVAGGAGCAGGSATGPGLTLALAALAFTLARRRRTGA